MHNTYEAPYLSSYEQALEHFNKVPPIRGTTPIVKPVGKRRYHMCASIEKHGDEVLLRYEGHVAVKWRPDNTFTLYAPHYYHASQAPKLNGWLPYGFYFVWDKKRLFVCSRGDFTKVQLNKNESLEFAFKGPDASAPKYRCLDVTQPVEYKARRGVANKLVQQHFGAFIAWAQVVMGGNGRFNPAELSASYERYMHELGYTEVMIDASKRTLAQMKDSQARQELSMFTYGLNSLPFRLGGRNTAWFSKPGCDLVLKHMSTDSYEEWPHMLNIAARHSGSYTYRYGPNQSFFLLDLPRLEKYLKHLVSFLYRDEVFEVVPVQAGTIPSATNAEYFIELKHVF